MVIQTASHRHWLLYATTIAGTVVATASLQTLQGMDPEKKYQATLVPVAYDRQTIDKVTRAVYDQNPIMHLPAELIGIIDEYVPLVEEEIPLPSTVRNKPVKTFSISDKGVIRVSSAYKEKDRISQQRSKEIEQILSTPLPKQKIFLSKTPLSAAQDAIVVTRIAGSHEICILRKDHKKGTYAVEILPSSAKPEALSPSGHYLVTRSLVLGKHPSKKYTVWNTQTHPATKVGSAKGITTDSIVKPILHNQQPSLLIASPERDSTGTASISLYLHHFTAKKNSRNLVYYAPYNLENNSLAEGLFGAQMPLVMSPSWQQLLIGRSQHSGVKLQLETSPLAHLQHEVSREILKKLQEQASPKTGCIQS